MSAVFPSTRYVVFALSISCDAVIASVAVWNFGFVQYLEETYVLDIYLTFVGAFGLAVVFLVVSVELLTERSLTGHVWFECLWMGVLFVLNTVGASYLSAHQPPVCTTRATRLLGSASCNSTQVLMAFIWMHTGVLLCYLTLLTILCLIRQGSETRIWHTSVRDLLNPGSFWKLKASSPSSPSGPSPPEHRISRTRPAPATIVAPKPRRPPHPGDEMAGLQTYYDVDAYEHDPRKHALPSSTVLPFSADTPPRLYSHQVHSAMPDVLPPARTRDTRWSRGGIPLPPPLGDWPRADITSQPVQKKAHKAAPTELPSNVQEDYDDYHDRYGLPRNIQDSGNPWHGSLEPLFPDRDHPAIPRTRPVAGPRPKPPPLDLSKGVHE